jgi:hypothetical protein
VAGAPEQYTGAICRQHPPNQRANAPSDHPALPKLSQLYLQTQPSTHSTTAAKRTSPADPGPAPNRSSSSGREAWGSVVRAAAAANSSALLMPATGDAGGAALPPAGRLCTGSPGAVSSASAAPPEVV